MQKERGMFIVFEGIDGAGKSRQVELLECYFRVEYPEQPVIITREPGGTPLAEEFRRLVKTPCEESMDIRTELMLFYCARLQHIKNVIEPALNEGKIVISDRFDMTSQAYQGTARGYQKEVDVLSQFINIVPDFTFILDIDPSIAQKRIRKDHINRKADRFDAETISFMELARSRYITEALRDPKRNILIAADNDVDIVHELVITEFLNRL